MSVKLMVYEYQAKEQRRETLANALAEYSGKSDIEIIYSSSGKPYVKEEHGIYLSVTTTGEIMMFAFADTPIGIDGEYLPRLSDPQRKTDYNTLAERFFAPDEVDYVRSGDNTPHRFAKVWVRKEAYVKYTGRGLVEFPKFSVCDGVAFYDKVFNVPLGTFKTDFPMSDDYLFAYAGNFEPSDFKL
ncbi:MAG: 4'-phosphopantetheinyl transferase superfamily protein [Eubacteriales bacterium]|nr:4'-phosphopantetheinyl transferase superfamily protein [Eubacteriales bacterium]MDD4474894.1 4'-phosphopantetheinyl transferase superfamily protein [Eubacteriales bacterium]